MNTRYDSLQSFQSELEPTKPKLAHDTPTSSSLRASVLDRCWTCITSKRVELQLSLVPDLWGQVLISGNV